ncbi:adenine nucleotide alpha hydrolase family protein, partial [Adlercreutzia equolifaciens]
MADIWVGVNGADEALRQVNAEMLGGARALADQAGATVVAVVWGASAAGHAKALASWGADRVVIVESEAAPAPEAV